MRIGVDIDGTIANTIEVVYGTLFGKSVSPSILGQYDLSPYGADDLFAQEWVYEKAQPYRAAARVLRALAEQGHELVYITRRCSSMISVTSRWIFRHNFPDCSVIHNILKYKAIEIFGIEIMIEDAPDEITQLEGLVKTIVIDRPYNRDLLAERAKNWLEVPELIKRLTREDEIYVG